MKDILKELNAAYELISVIPVSGDRVEVMASARERLRTAYKLLDEASKEQEDGNG